MKSIISLVLGMVIANSVVSAAEVGTPEKTGGFLSDVYVAPVGVYKIPNIHDTGEWGAGLEVGVQLNKYVSLGIVNISYAGDDLWNNSGLLVDETDLKVRATLFSSENKVFSLQAVGSGNRDWNTDDWGFGVGAGVRINLSKNLSLNADSQIRAWLNNPKDLLNTASLQWTF